LEIQSVREFSGGRLVFAEEGGGGVRRLDAVTDEEGVDGGILATETTVDYVGSFRATLLEDVVAEFVGSFAVEDAIGLELGKSISIEYLGPLIRIVAGSVAP
jgi:hypothetical protein